MKRVALLICVLVFIAASVPVPAQAPPAYVLPFKVGQCVYFSGGAGLNEAVKIVEVFGSWVRYEPTTANPQNPHWLNTAVATAAEIRPCK
jgi:hypothetical protein